MIPFNKPFSSGHELEYIADAIKQGKIAGDGLYTKKCHAFFEEKYDFQKVLMTTSCTDALEMVAILLDIQPGDEVIVPSYTFVSTVNAFALRGAKIVFADSCKEHPNVDPQQIADLITSNTKAIIVVHYAGTACDMDPIMELSNKYNIPVVEDAAQAIDGYYKGRPLGSIGTFGTLSFHETKNIISGEGGLLIINDSKFNLRAEIIREKGTNRSSFFRGEVDKYGWVDIGSSFLPSDIIAAYLYAQLENIDVIQSKRIAIWNHYYNKLSDILMGSNIRLPKIFDYSSNNAHMFYLICDDLEQRTKLIEYLKSVGIHAVFHYLSLHNSEFHQGEYSGNELKNSDFFTDSLIRLPLFYDLTEEQVEYVCDKIQHFISS
ncbi:dTDP-4-amino-4,6-dideoxygalactose transaminase [Vibrio owensii]|uniref:dTDP-4-amino-4,6-dideoxygalactose transaminase n=1 Tax=Vibrio owensii TaxID=696485 RepID=UPI0033956F7C